jgi:hypothetical protein
MFPFIVGSHYRKGFGMSNGTKNQSSLRFDGGKAPLPLGNNTEARLRKASARSTCLKAGRKEDGPEYRQRPALGGNWRLLEAPEILKFSFLYSPFHQR